MKLWLQRHAPVLLAPGLCYGATDVAADATATAQAAAQAADVLPMGASVWYSPLQRCERLAQDLRGLRPDLSFQSDPRLREMDFGAWEGQAWDAIARAEMDAWVANFGDYRPGGGESTQAVLERTGQALDDWRAAQAAGQRAGLWITHAGVIRCAGLWHQGVRRLERADQWPTQTVAWGSLAALSWQAP